MHKKLRLPEQSHAFYPMLLVLAMALQVQAGLKLTAPAGYLPGVPFLVRVEVLTANGAHDSDLWDAQALLTTDQPGVGLSTNRVLLRNGVGTALLTLQGSTSFDLTASIGAQQATRTVASLIGRPVQKVSGTLAGTSTSWSGIVNVTGPVTVPAGHTLTIQSNTLIIIDGSASGTSGTSLIINGSIQSLGTETSPITITTSDPSKNWGQIRHDNAAASTYQYTFISKAGRVTGEGHTGTGPALRPTSSTLAFDNCVISDLDAGGSNIGKVMMAAGSTLTFKDCVLTRARMGPEIATTSLGCTNTWIMDMKGPDDADGIYLHDSAGRPLTLSGCVIANGDDDAIDTLDSSVTVENSILRDWANPNEDAKAVSAFHGEVRLNRCLIVNCFDGVSAKSGGSLAVVRMDHCSVVAHNKGVSATWKSNATAGNINFYLTNCIVQGTDALNSDFGPEKFVSVTYCLAAEAWPGIGNLVDDPRFVNSATGNYHLQAGSPAIDAGDPAYPMDPNGTRTEIGFYPSDLPPPALLCRITSPASGALFIAPTNMLISATASSTGTVAKVEFFQDGNKLGEDLTLPYSISWNAQKIGSFILTAVAGDTGGLRATSAPVVVSLMSGEGPSTNTLIAAGSTWRYLDDGSDQGANWVQPLFNVSAWKTGEAKFGYGDGDEATVLSFGPSSANKYVTYYFRSQFVLDEPSRVTALNLNLLRDDGALVYLNGVEVYRISMPTGAISYQTYATTASEYAWQAASVPFSALKVGTNVIAVEVHQGNASSSDLAFDLELQAVLSAPANIRPLVALTSPADGITVASGASVMIAASAQDLDGTVTNVSFHANGQLLGTAPSQPYTFSWNGIPAGSYSLTATATDEKGASRESTPIVLLASTNISPPRIIARTPPPGPITDLTQLTVTFSKPVTGVDAGDLLVNGLPAVRVSGTDTQYVFVLPSLPPGLVAVTWSAGHGIIDTFTPPTPFDGSAAGATWQYQFTDITAPVISSLTPVAGATVPVLTNVTVMFSEIVTGVDASDLLVNSIPAAAVTGTGAGPYTFKLAEPSPGTVTLSWSPTHGLRDQANNSFVGNPWQVVLTPWKVGIVINEIMYHPASEDPREEFIELFNRESWPVNLQGWTLGDAVDFTFPDVTLTPGGHLVVAADLSTFRSKYPGITNVIGNWSGILSNSREAIDLDDAQGHRINSVKYADEGDWGTRRRGLNDRGHRGWSWSADHDGVGKTIELINPQVDNTTGSAWASSIIPQGTPGRPNSLLTNNVAPVIRNVAHIPIIPKSTDAVVIAAHVLDETDTTPTVTLSYRIDSLTPPPFTMVSMHDDGLDGDASANDRVYSVRLAAQANNTVIEFYVVATDSSELSRTWPAPAAPALDGTGSSGQVANALFQVDDTLNSGTQPLYKIIMREEERLELEAIGNNVGGAANSDAQMNATFISVDATGTELHYLAGIRNRGHGTRTAKPNNFRVNFRSDDTWKTVTAINLNSQFSWLQVLGSALHIRSGSLGAYSQPVQLRINNANLAFTGPTDRTYGSYAANEVVDADWADRHLPNDSEGNIYRALRDIAPSEFDYRTLAAYPGLYGPEDKRSYTNTWLKASNASEDDWTDLIGFLRVFGPNGTEPFTEENVRRVLNVEETLRDLAIMNLLGNSETALNTGYNDDYQLYRGIHDPRFMVLYYDLDQILGYNGSFGPTASLFSASDNNGAGAAFGRFIQAPEFQTIFLRVFQELIDTTFSAPQFDALVEQTLGDFVPDVARTQVKSWMALRRAHVQSQLPPLTSEKPPVATITGAPRSPTPKNTATLIVGGEGVTEYSYALNNGSFGAATPVSAPITLSALPEGTNRVRVIGRNAAGAYQSSLNPAVASWVVNTSLPTVRLNEIIASRSGGLRDTIELFNEGATAVDLAGLQLTDNPDQPGKYVFGSISLQPGAYRVVDSAALGFNLDAEGEGVYLFDTASRGGKLLDSCAFGRQIIDFSIGRIGAAGEWQLTVPTFGAANVAQPLGNCANVKINEWLASGVAPFPNDFVELYNPDSLPMAIGGCFLTDHLYGDPTRSPIAPLSFLPAKGYLSFTSGNGNQPDEINFGLAAEQGEIALLAPNLSVIDSVFYNSQNAGISTGRCPDGDWAQKALMVPTPGGPNQCPYTPPPPVSVTLIPFTNTWKYSSGTDLGTAWRATNFNDFAWSSGPGVLGFEDATLPQPLLTVLASGEITYYFRTTFRVDPALAANSLQITTLIDDGAAFYLNGQEVGSRYSLADNAGNQTPASDTVGNASYQVFSLSPTLLRPGNNWFAVEVHQASRTSSDMVFGMELKALIVTNTPAQSGIVINEVFANNSLFLDSDGSVPDWVELYNPSSEPVDLAGMSLTDDSGNPGRWIFPGGSLLLGKSFLKVRCNPDLPTSVTNSGFGLAANGGTVYLFRSPKDGGTIQSSVSYGLMPSDWSIGRVPDGGSNWVLTLPTLGIANIAVSLGKPELLKLNEWMADPLSGDDWFELFNPNPEPVQISGLGLSDTLLTPLKHQLPPLSFIGNGGFLRFVADENPAAGADHVTFKLSASGEALSLSLPNGALIDAVTFGAQLPGVSQGRLPDGNSRIVDFASSASPGASNYLPLPDVVVNELLSHTDPPLEDAVEFYNPSGDEVEISGWFLSDSALNLRKYEVPANTVIPAHGYLVLYEGQFNSAAANEPFSFSSVRGDQVFLSQAVVGVLTGYRAAASFEAAQNAVSFGRFETSEGAHFVAMSRRTFGNDNPANTDEFRLGSGAANAYPKVGPVVISEIMYHPAITNDALEFVELHNLTAQSVPLYDPLHPENTWRLRKGVDLDFPQGLSIPAHGTLVVVSFNPQLDLEARSLFVSTYGSGATLVGPYSDKLDNAGETIELLQPDPPQPSPGPDAGFVPYILVDRITYGDASPWPAAADGSGQSLQKVDPSLYGDDPANWTAGAPRPGSTDADADSMADGWELANGFNPTSAADGSTDIDKDGFTNAQEYMLGTDPRDLASVLVLELAATPEGSLALQFTARPGRSYSVEASDRVTGGWLPFAALEPLASSGVMMLPVSPTGSTRYFRIRSGL